MLFHVVQLPSTCLRGVNVHVIILATVTVLHATFLAEHCIGCVTNFFCMSKDLKIKSKINTQFTGLCQSEYETAHVDRNSSYLGADFPRDRFLDNVSILSQI